MPWFAWVPVLGPFLQRLGVFHLMADGAKFLFKEEPVPGHVNKFYFIIAPAVALIPALSTVVVVPFGAWFNAAGQLVVIYDPLTTRVDPVSGQLVRDAFPGAGVIIHQDPEGVAERRAVFPGERPESPFY